MTADKVKSTIVRTTTGYLIDFSELTTFVLHFDHDGNYLGQEQDRVEGVGTVFLPAEIVNGVPCVNGKPATRMSAAEMARAT